MTCKTTRQTTHGGAPSKDHLPFAATMIAAVAMLAACAASAQDAPPSSGALEDIYILHSIREPQEPTADWCSPERTGFDPAPADAERFFSFWSVETRAEDGQVVDAARARVAELRGCFGPTDEPARQNFYAEIELGEIFVRGRGECLAMMVNFPEAGLFPVRCQLALSDAPAPYVGGLLTTNTMTSMAPMGAATEPPGTTQASCATIRLWKARSSP